MACRPRSLSRVRLYHATSVAAYSFPFRPALPGARNHSLSRLQSGADTSCPVVVRGRSAAAAAGAGAFSHRLGTVHFRPAKCMRRQHGRIDARPADCCLQRAAPSMGRALASRQHHPQAVFDHPGAGCPAAPPVAIFGVHRAGGLAAAASLPWALAPVSACFAGAQWRLLPCLHLSGAAVRNAAGRCAPLRQPSLHGVLGRNVFPGALSRLIAGAFAPYSGPLRPLDARLARAGLFLCGSAGHGGPGIAAGNRPQASAAPGRTVGLFWISAARNSRGAGNQRSSVDL